MTGHAIQHERCTRFEWQMQHSFSTASPSVGLRHSGPNAHPVADSASNNAISSGTSSIALPPALCALSTGVEPFGKVIAVRETSSLLSSRTRTKSVSSPGRFRHCCQMLPRLELRPQSSQEQSQSPLREAASQQAIRFRPHSSSRRSRTARLEASASPSRARSHGEAKSSPAWRSGGQGHQDDV